MVFRNGGSVGGCDADGVTNSDLTSIVKQQQLSRGTTLLTVGGALHCPPSGVTTHLTIGGTMLSTVKRHYTIDSWGALHCQPSGVTTLLTIGGTMLSTVKRHYTIDSWGALHCRPSGVTALLTIGGHYTVNISNNRTTGIQFNG